jgi:hypothetical protein
MNSLSSRVMSKQIHMPAGKEESMHDGVCHYGCISEVVQKLTKYSVF